MKDLEAAKGECQPLNVEAGPKFLPQHGFKSSRPYRFLVIAALAILGVLMWTNTLEMNKFAAIHFFDSSDDSSDSSDSNSGSYDSSDSSDSSDKAPLLFDPFDGVTSGMNTP